MAKQRLAIIFLYKSLTVYLRNSSVIYSLEPSFYHFFRDLNIDKGKKITGNFQLTLTLVFYSEFVLYCKTD